MVSLTMRGVGVGVMDGPGAKNPDGAYKDNQ